MALATVAAESSPGIHTGVGLREIVPLPEWLVAIAQSERVIEALSRAVPELNIGAMSIHACKIKHLGLDDGTGCWSGDYTCTVEGPPPAPRRSVQLRGRLVPPGMAEPDLPGRPPAVAFGADGWFCYLPELRLELKPLPPEPELPALPLLTDPIQARAFLEQSIRAGSAAYQGLRIESCEPDMARSRVGVRHVIRYGLTYGADTPANHSWPALVVAKTYDGDLGQNAYSCMRALWESPLRTANVVSIAEPLAYVPEWKLLVQAPLPEEQTLEQLLRATLREPTLEAMTRLEGIVRRVAAGLAALHSSGARAEESLDWEERSSTIPEALERITVVAPDLSADVAPLFERLLALDAAHPAGPPVPSHGSFDGDQILLADDSIGFIDFDNFCMAEPALDVSHFRAAIMDSGMQVVDAATLHDPAAFRAYQDRLSHLYEIFLEEYRARAPISLERIAVWELWDYLRDALHLWTKPKLDGADAVVRNLEFQLERMGWME